MASSSAPVDSDLSIFDFKPGEVCEYTPYKFRKFILDRIQLEKTLPSFTNKSQDDFEKRFWAMIERVKILEAQAQSKFNKSVGDRVCFKNEEGNDEIGIITDIIPPKIIRRDVIPPVWPTKVYVKRKNSKTLKLLESTDPYERPAYGIVVPIYKSRYTEIQKQFPVRIQVPGLSTHLRSDTVNQKKYKDLLYKEAGEITDRIQPNSNVTEVTEEYVANNDPNDALLGGFRRKRTIRRRLKKSKQTRRKRIPLKL